MNWFKRKPTPSIAAAATAGAGSAVVTSGALREFVYLDEVSVYSLTSSPDLPPPVSMSEAANTTSGEALSTQLDVGAPGLVKSGVKAELKSGRTNALEVQRQFNIQSQFARLHRLYSSSFALTANDEPVDAQPSDNLAIALESLRAERRAARADSLVRGALTELRVALRAHSMFDVAVFIKAAGGLIERHPELIPVSDPQTIRQMTELGDVLNELMEDLVPIEGLSATYRVVLDAHGDQWVVDLQALKQLFTGSVVSSPLRVVGVAEQDSFWKDTRRILHSDAEFDILGRVSRSGLQPDWSPVKLTDAFDRVVPGVGKSLNQALNTLKQLASGIASSANESTVFLLVALKFEEDLGSHHGVAPPELPEAVIQSLLTADDALEGQLAILNQVADYFYSQHEDLVRDPEVEASLRQGARRSVQLLADLPEQATEQMGEPEPPALELEFVAMYW